jgi:hypothetical protein
MESWNSGAFLGALTRATPALLHSVEVDKGRLQTMHTHEPAFPSLVSSGDSPKGT